MLRRLHFSCGLRRLSTAVQRQMCSLHRDAGYISIRAPLRALATLQQLREKHRYNIVDAELRQLVSK
jgi:hypothetical protein